MIIDLETILAIVISLITINLLLVGFYIVKVLREVLLTVRKAQEVMDEVDESIKDGVEKVKAMEKPLEAMAVTTAALSGVVKGAGVITKATRSILGSHHKDSDIDEKHKSFKKRRVLKRPRFFKKAE